jgi:membrane protein DedA with SNARE-associated domain
MDTLESILHATLVFVETHKAFSAPVVFLLAMGESVAVLSLLFPATVVLVGIGAMVGAGALDFWSLWIAAAVGAIIGDWVSYWLGARYGHAVFAVWPMRNHPELLPRGERFFHRWGIASVFVGRFFGPFRASVTLIAGIFAMDRLAFLATTTLSAFIWAAGLLAPGIIGVRLFA